MEIGESLPYGPTVVAGQKAVWPAGIWASEPYRHNGSVASICELLSPEVERRAIFWTSWRQLDRERSFVSDVAPGLCRFDMSLPGKRSPEHRYSPQALDHEERMAVIDYLETL